MVVNVFAKRCVQFMRKGMHVLDLGCGYGADAMYFAKNGMKVTAIDFSSTSIDQVRERAANLSIALRAIQHDVSNKLPFPAATFNAVYAHLSLHYFDDETTSAIFAEIRRVLKPGGVLFVKCKSVDDPLYGKGKKIGPDMYHSEHVRRFFRKEYMEYCLRDWKILRLKRTSSVYTKYRSAFIEAIARKPVSSRA